MKSILTSVLSLILVIPAMSQSYEEAEPQISFVKESKPHRYYVRQAELWWDIIDEDRQNEEAWFYYYRACRNAQATANWRTDFVEESDALRLGDEIVTLMEINIPGTFVYHFVRGSTGGVTIDQGHHLLTAYQMNPDFEGLLPAVVSYATSSFDYELRKEANIRWHQNQGLSQGLLTFGYNLLQSVGQDGILLTQHDNDTYPVWMLQEALGIREDVTVINIDFLLLEEYRAPIFDSLGIPPFSLEEIDINEYETNWRNVVQHSLGTYSGERPLFVSQTVSPQWLEGMEHQLYPSGFTMKFGETPEEFDWDQLMLDVAIFPLEADPIQSRIDEMYLQIVRSFFSQNRQLIAEGSELELLVEALTIRNASHPLIIEYLKNSTAGMGEE